ncbi:hypothetical protein ACJIZ3_008605 [Penstemon smallii]|uniref:Uncharacterized protein n=1 Tax=Penstemon smallii TaxID=265156 RepID=A0ABD3TAB4_9LAMI
MRPDDKDDLSRYLNVEARILLIPKTYSSIGNMDL